jgi:hypothetical protein
VAGGEKFACQNVEQRKNSNLNIAYQNAKWGCFGGVKKSAFFNTLKNTHKNLFCRRGLMKKGGKRLVQKE